MLRKNQICLLQISIFSHFKFHIYIYIYRIFVEYTICFNLKSYTSLNMQRTNLCLTFVKLIFFKYIYHLSTCFTLNASNVSVLRVLVCKAIYLQACYNIFTYSCTKTSNALLFPIFYRNNFKHSICYVFHFRNPFLFKNS